MLISVLKQGVIAPDKWGEWDMSGEVRVEGKKDGDVGEKAGLEIETDKWKADEFGAGE